jgi:hypothetical protein
MQGLDGEIEKLQAEKDKLQAELDGGGGLALLLATVRGFIRLLSAVRCRVRKYRVWCGLVAG